MNGYFNINKPEGLTSHDVVARVRGMSGQRKVGHAGTLDPLATGVLPVALGSATRLLEYVSDAEKGYRARLVFGATSDTYDREGVVTPIVGPALPSIQEVRAAVDRFKGEIEQLPPMHSAVKVGGKKLYELARAGIDIERKPRRVTISRLEIEEYAAPLLSIAVECSKGTYIRSLAHDLGQVLGAGAYLDRLVRTRHGPFQIERSVDLETLQDAFLRRAWQQYLYPPEFVLSGWRKYEATATEVEDLAEGRPLHLAPPEGPYTSLAATSRDGELLAILYWDPERGFWKPAKVLIQR